ncbi:MAG: prenyltransferase [Pseudomonadota bacterium]|nr:prenyltransferase [Pseudomonadota bacterium]
MPLWQSWGEVVLQNIKTVVMASRPNFLVLSFSVVLMATSVANFQGFSWSWWLFVMTIFGAVLAHAAVNLLNEFQDNQSGLDFITDKTPFSGGSGALQLNPQAAESVWNSFKAIVMVLILLGLLFVYLKGWQILPIGILGLAVIALYTSKITKSPLICLIAPGLAFGPLMVVGSYFILTGEISALVVALSMVPFFLVNNLLLLNQVPDLNADKQVGRYNILMKIGVARAMYVFSAFVLLALFSLLISINYFDLPNITMLGLVGFVLAIPMIIIAVKYYDNLDKLMPALGMNVIINISIPALIALGLWLA